jgi:hypothetical protein
MEPTRMLNDTPNGFIVPIDGAARSFAALTRDWHTAALGVSRRVLEKLSKC